MRAVGNILGALRGLHDALGLKGGGQAVTGTRLYAGRQGAGVTMAKLMIDERVRWTYVRSAGPKGQLRRMTRSRLVRRERSNATISFQREKEGGLGQFSLGLLSRRAGTGR